MSNEDTRKWANEQRKREEDSKHRSGHRFETCLHCGNAFPADAGVVTPDAFVCDVCNGD